MQFRSSIDRFKQRCEEAGALRLLEDLYAAIGPNQKALLSYCAEGSRAVEWSKAQVLVGSMEANTGYELGSLYRYMMQRNPEKKSLDIQTLYMLAYKWAANVYDETLKQENTVESESAASSNEESNYDPIK